jgi:hypothetical protein
VAVAGAGEGRKTGPTTGCGIELNVIRQIVGLYAKLLSYPKGSFSTAAFYVRCLVHDADGLVVPRRDGAAFLAQSRT